ncbi:MAG: hypothetical protein WB774_11345, partial [Xanthobacteraceae bacterium]
PNDAVDGSSTRRASAMDVGAVKAPTIRRSYLCKRSRQSVWISQQTSVINVIRAHLAEFGIVAWLHRSMLHW